MEELLEILNGMNLDIDFENCDSLIDDGILASLDIVNIIAELSDAYDIRIPAKEIIPENFNSASAMYEMVQRLMED